MPCNTGEYCVIRGVFVENPEATGLSHPVSVVEVVGKQGPGIK